jgi:hypothetical protein
MRGRLHKIEKQINKSNSFDKYFFCFLKDGIYDVDENYLIEIGLNPEDYPLRKEEGNTQRKRVIDEETFKPLMKNRDGIKLMIYKIINGSTKD